MTMRSAQSAVATVLCAMLAAVLTFGTVSALTGGDAVAQPGHEGHAHAQPGAAAAAGDDAADDHAADGEHAGVTQRLDHSKAAAPIFWLFALMVVGGSIFVVTRKNLIAAVMGMVGTFFAIAAVYVMLYAHFLAAIQVLVYAGAIMVLFVFVIMILNRPETDVWARQATVGKVLTVLAAAYLCFRIGGVMWDVTPKNETAGQLPDKIQLLPAHNDADGKPVEALEADFGSSKAVGKTLFTSYLFPFEAVSLVLLIAVVGAIAVARPHENRVLGNLGGGEAGGAS